MCCVGATPALAQAPEGLTTFATTRSWIVLSVPSIRDIAAERVRLGELMQECRGIIDISPVDSAAVVSRARPSLEGKLSATNSIVEITVTPRAEFPYDCGNPSRTSGLLADRAQWMAFDAPMTADRGLVAVRVTLGGRELSPLATERLVIRQLGPDGYLATNGEAVRVAFRLEDLAPSDLGDSPELIVHVESEVGVTAESILLRWPQLRDFWGATLATRARTLPAVPPPMTLPAPRDSVLRLAYTAYNAGAMSTAARVANRRLRQGELSEQDTRWARALSAVAFGAADDSLATRVSLEFLAQLEPCLRWADGAPNLVQSMANQIDRPIARCEALSARRTLVRSLLMPGFGRPTGHRGMIAPRALVASAIVGTAVYSQVLRRSARNHYEEYLKYPDLNIPFPSARTQALYTKATEAQAKGRQAVTVAAVAYVAQAAASVLLEWQMKRRLRPVMPYGSSSPKVGLQVDPRTARVGFGVQWVW